MGKYCFSVNYLLGNKGAHIYNGNIFICQDCGKEYKTRRGLQNHSCVKCIKCNKIFPTKQRLDKHKCYTSNMFCQKCEQQFATNQNLTHHKCRHCPQCEVTFSSYQRLKSHKCSKEEPMKCKTCHKLYKTKTGLTNHVCNVCSICNKVFPSSKSLGMHICKSSVHDQSNILKHHEHNQQNIRNSDQNISQDSEVQENPARRYQEQNMSNLHRGCQIEGDYIKSEQKRKKHSDVDIGEGNIKCKKNPEIREKDNTARKQPSKVCKKDGKEELQVQFRNLTLSQVRTFKPVDESWQKAQCDKLTLNYNRIAYTSNAPDSQNLNTTQPATVKQIIGDGNCFFRSLSYIISGTEDNHLQVRDCIVFHMYTLQDRITSVMPVVTTVDQYLQRSNMRQPGVWATQVELFTAAHLLKTNIYLYTRQGALFKWMEYSSTFIDKTSKAGAMSIYLNHKNQNHFEVVLSVIKRNNDEAVYFEMVRNEIQKQVKMSEKKREMINVNITEELKRKKDGERKSNLHKSAENREKENPQMTDKEKPTVSGVGESINTQRIQSAAYKDKERQRKANARQSAEYREKEKQHKMSLHYKGKQRQHKEEKRQSAEYKEKERRHKDSSEYKEKERQNKERKRQASEYKEKERQHKDSSEYKEKERQNKERKRQASEYKDKERQHKDSSEYKEKERQNKERKRQASEYKEKERQHKDSSEYKKKERQNKERKRQESEYQEKERRHKDSSEYKKKERQNKERKRQASEYK